VDGGGVATCGELSCPEFTEGVESVEDWFGVVGGVVVSAPTFCEVGVPTLSVVGIAGAVAGGVMVAGGVVVEVELVESVGVVACGELVESVEVLETELSTFVVVGGETLSAVSAFITEADKFAGEATCRAAFVL